MNYGLKKKKKPTKDELTFGKAKNCWIDYMSGRNGYENVKNLMDEIRNDYLLGDKEKWDEWKATPLIAMDKELISFVNWKVNNITEWWERSEKLLIVKMFIDYVNEKLLKSNSFSGDILFETRKELWSLTLSHNEDDYEEIVFDEDEEL